MGLLDQIKDIKNNISEANKLVTAQNDIIRQSNEKSIQNLENILIKLKQNLHAIENIIKKESLPKRKASHEGIKKSLLLSITQVLLSLVEKLDSENPTNENLQKAERYRSELKNCHTDNLALSESEKERIKKHSANLSQQLETLFNNSNNNNIDANFVNSKINFGNVQILVKELNQNDNEFYEQVTKAINYFTENYSNIKNGADVSLTLSVMKEVNIILQSAANKLSSLSEKEKDDNTMQVRACEVLQRQIKAGFKAIFHHSILDQPQTQQALITGINTARKLGLEFAKNSKTDQEKFEKAKTKINKLAIPYYNSNLEDRARLKSAQGQTKISDIKRDTSIFKEIDEIIYAIENAISAFNDMQFKHGQQLVSANIIAFVYITQDIWDEIKSYITKFEELKKAIDLSLQHKEAFFSTSKQHFNNPTLEEYVGKRLQKNRLSLVNKLIRANEFMATINRHIADSYLITKGVSNRDNAKPYYTLSKQYIDAAVTVMRNEKHSLIQKDIDSILEQESKINRFYNLHCQNKKKESKSQLDTLVDVARNCTDLNKGKAAYHRAITQAKKDNNKDVQITLQEEIVKTILLIEKMEISTTENNYTKYFNLKIDWANSILEILNDAISTRKTLPKECGQLSEKSRKICSHLNELSTYFLVGSLTAQLDNHLKFREQLLMFSLKIAHQLIDFANYVGDDSDLYQTHMQKVQQEIDRVKHQQRMVSEEIARKKMEEDENKKINEIYQNNFETILKLFPSKPKKHEKKSQEDIESEYLKCLMEFRADQIITEEWLTPQYIDNFAQDNAHAPVKKVSIDEHKSDLKNAITSNNTILILKSYMNLAEDHRRLAFLFNSQYSYDDAINELQQAEINLSEARNYLLEAKTFVSPENKGLDLEVFEDWLTWMLNDSLLKINVMYILQKNLTEKSDRDYAAAKSRVILREGTKAWVDYESNNYQYLSSLSTHDYEEEKELYIQQEGLKAWKKFGPTNPFSIDKLSLPARMRKIQHERFSRIEGIREQIMNVAPELIDEQLKDIPISKDESNAPQVIRLENKSTTPEHKQTWKEKFSLKMNLNQARFFSRSEEWQEKSAFSRLPENVRHQKNDEELTQRIDDALMFNPPTLKRSESFNSSLGIKATEIRFFHRADNNSLSIDQQIEIENTKKGKLGGEIGHIFEKLFNRT